MCQLGYINHLTQDSKQNKTHLTVLLLPTDMSKTMFEFPLSTTCTMLSCHFTCAIVHPHLSITAWIGCIQLLRQSKNVFKSQMKNEAHIKLKVWILTTRVAGIGCPLVTIKQCHIVNALIGRITAFPANTSSLCFDVAKGGDLTNFLSITENLLF